MNLTEIATYLDQAALKVEAVEQVTHNTNFSLEEAYQIQRLSIEQRLNRGEEIVGYKLGFTSYAKMEQMGVHDLIWGILTNSMHLMPADQVNINRWIHPRAEPEVAFQVKKDIDRPISIEEVPDYIDKMTVGLEIIDSRYKDFKFTLEDVVADNCSSTGFVLGEWQDLQYPFSALDINLQIDNQIVESGSSSAILNNPLQSIVELSRLASASGLTVKSGQIILAGAATAAVYLKPHQQVTAKLENYGEVCFSTL